MLREVAAQFERPAMLFSGGKDSIVMAHLAQRAFCPASPFPLMHIDTGHNFPETLAFRDQLVAALGVQPDRALRPGLDRPGARAGGTGAQPQPQRLQTVTLLDAMPNYGFDAAMGGARRDEEKARAKERFFSHRDRFGQWDPKNQRPELWNLYNGRKHQGEHFRVFPLSNWTEMDVWHYIQWKEIRCRRSTSPTGATCAARTACCWPSPRASPCCPARVENKLVRFRTIGDMTCTGAVSPPPRPRRDHPGDRRRPRHRTRHARRRQAVGNRDGRPQARGVLLVA